MNAAVEDQQREDRAIHDYPLVRPSDDELYRAGVPPPLIPAVRGIGADAELEALAAYVPPDCRDVLYGIAAGMHLDEALEEMLGLAAATVEQPAPETPGDFTHLTSR